MAKQRFCSECKRKLGSDEPDPHDACIAIDDIDRACNQWWSAVNGEGLCYNNTRRVIWRAATRWAGEQMNKENG